MLLLWRLLEGRVLAGGLDHGEAEVQAGLEAAMVLFDVVLVEGCVIEG